MVHNTIHATYTETYDLNTVQNEISLLAIHTPQAAALTRMYEGIMKQYRKVKVLGCNFRMVCATTQQLTPADVGLTAGKTSPRDVLNPILFKACTGEGIDAFLDQIYNDGQVVTPEGSVGQHRVTGQDAINTYYNLLADDSFRREHPQRGITVQGLKPYVHRIASTQPFKYGNAASGNQYISGSSVANFSAPSGSANIAEDPYNPVVFVSNGLVDMPWIETAYKKLINVDDGTSGGTQRAAYVLMGKLPRVYMGLLVLPPSELQQLYYRLQIVWHLAFKDFRPATELLPVSVPNGSEFPGVLADGMANNVSTYYNYYHTASKLETDYGSFDTTGVESVECLNEKIA